jgi:hypothetical protein
MKRERESISLTQNEPHDRRNQMKRPNPHQNKKRKNQHPSRDPRKKKELKKI